MRRVLVLITTLVCALCATAPGALAAPRESAARVHAESVLKRTRNLFDGDGVRTGRELTPALAELAARKGALDTSDKREADEILARPTDNPDHDPDDHRYTTTEHAPYCATAHFCVHYVTTTADAPSLADSNTNGWPDYVETMANEFEFVYSIENSAGGLGWAAPKADGTKGGNSKTDVYIEQIGNNGIYGYAAPDSDQSGTTRSAYLVMDDDYAEFAPLDWLSALRVTAAHEYNHVLQFRYDSLQDTWMLESTATWAEEKVYPAINDYLNYVNAWTPCSATPLTESARSGANCDVFKQYGDAVWNHWVDARYGSDSIRRAWEVSPDTTLQGFAPQAYDSSIHAEGGAGFGDEFGKFTAATAEWRTPSSVFPDHASYPDVTRIGSTMTTNGPSQAVTLNHAAFALVNVVPDPTIDSIELHADAPGGTDASIALVGRTGADSAAGTVTTSIQRLPSGGSGTVTLANPGLFGRITAVLANADFQQTGFDGNDWIWSRDGQSFQNVRITPPTPAAPKQSTTATKLTSKLAVASPQRLRTAIKRGVLARVRCNQACRVRVELRLDARTARRLHIKRVVATKVVTLSKAGAKNVRVKLGRKARLKLRGVRRVRLATRMRATHGSARAALLSRRVTLKR